VKFEWDEEKNRANILKHGLDFGDAHKIFDQPMLVGRDDRQEYGEDRWIGLGWLDTRIVVVVFVEPNEETIRVISLRKAISDERRRFKQAFRDEFRTP
jgi:hypothetical protein